MPQFPYNNLANTHGGNSGHTIELLNHILEGSDHKELLTALRQVACEFGGVQTVAEKFHLNPNQFYRLLSDNGHTCISTLSLSALLKALGMKLTIQPIRED